MAKHLFLTDRHGTWRLLETHATSDGFTIATAELGELDAGGTWTRLEDESGFPILHDFLL